MTGALTNDEFGYNRYMLVAMAPDEIEQQAQKIRDTVRQSEFRVVIPPHVTVVPPFVGIDSLDTIKQLAASISLSTPRMFLNFRDSVFEGHPEFGTAGIELVDQDEFLAFQRCLEQALAPHVGGSPYPEEWRYRKHMNYVMGLPEDLLNVAVEMGREVEIGDGFWVESIQLRAYSVGEDSEELHTLGEFPLGSD